MTSETFGFTSKLTRFDGCENVRFCEVLRTNAILLHLPSSMAAATLAFISNLDANIRAPSSGCIPHYCLRLRLPIGF
jgi:hypothetical protein